MLFLILSFALSSCGNKSQVNPWLIIVAGDTLTSEDLGMEWRLLSNTGRSRFLSDDNPVGNYLVAVSRREILKRELESLGYFDTEKITVEGTLWRRIEGAIACREFLNSKALANVTEEDLANYRYFVGTSVWYTINPNQQDVVSEGPEHLAEISFELAFCLDSLELDEIGESAGGVTVRLDSVVKTAPALIADALADSVTFNETATSRIALGRVRRQYIEWQENMYDDYNIEIDSSAVLDLAEYYANLIDIDINTIVIESDFGVWTVADMQYEIEFTETRMPTQPSTPTWLYFLIDNVLLHQILNNVLAEEAPHIVDSLGAESESWILEIAADELVGKVMEERVHITETDIEYEYTNMAEPIMIEEKRILEIALLPFDRQDEYEEATLESRGEIIAELPGYTYLLADSSGSRITTPLRMSDVPGGYGQSVFDIVPADTSKWIGPFPLSETRGSALFRLVEVIPERVATFEECYSTLEGRATNRIQETVLMEWLHELEEKHNLQINEEALSDLPSDPALW